MKKASKTTQKTTQKATKSPVTKDTSDHYSFQADKHGNVSSVSSTPIAPRRLPAASHQLMQFTNAELKQFAKTVGTLPPYCKTKAAIVNWLVNADTKFTCRLGD